MERRVPIHLYSISVLNGNFIPFHNLHDVNFYRIFFIFFFFDCCACCLEQLSKQKCPISRLFINTFLGCHFLLLIISYLCLISFKYITLNIPNGTLNDMHIIHLLFMCGWCLSHKSTTGMLYI